MKTCTAPFDLRGLIGLSLAFLEDVNPGDFVVVHVGYAISKIDPDEAARQLAAMGAPVREAAE